MNPGDVQRGTGPWPVSNSERDIRSWLGRRIESLEPRELEATVFWLLEAVSGLSKVDRLIEGWQASESQIERLAIWSDRLNHGEPLQYILGQVHFCGLDIKVDRRGLIPRPETEELVRGMQQRLIHQSRDTRRVLDVGTGSGVIALSWKNAFPQDEVTGVDLSHEALALAKANGKALSLDVTWRHGDVLAEGGLLLEGQFPFSVIFSNPPYIPEAERPSMASNVVEWEPNLALFVPNDDPLVFYRSIIHGCEQRDWLESGGWLALECHRDRVSDVAELFGEGWDEVEKARDLQGNWRMIFARRAD